MSDTISVESGEVVWRMSADVARNVGKFILWNVEQSDGAYYDAGLLLACADELDPPPVTPPSWRHRERRPDP